VGWCVCGCARVCVCARAVGPVRLPAGGRRGEAAARSARRRPPLSLSLCLGRVARRHRQAPPPLRVRRRERAHAPYRPSRPQARERAAMADHSAELEAELATLRAQVRCCVVVGARLGAPRGVRVRGGAAAHRRARAAAPLRRPPEPPAASPSRSHTYPPSPGRGAGHQRRPCGPGARFDVAAGGRRPAAGAAPANDMVVALFLVPPHAPPPFPHSLRPWRRASTRCSSSRASSRPITRA